MAASPPCRPLRPETQRQDETERKSEAESEGDAELRPGDVLVGVSIHRYSSDTVTAVEYASSRGVGYRPRPTTAARQSTPAPKNAREHMLALGLDPDAHSGTLPRPPRADRR